MVDPFDPRKILNSVGGWGPSGTTTTTTMPTATKAVGDPVPGLPGWVYGPGGIPMKQDTSTTYTTATDYDGSVTGVPGAVYQKSSSGAISIISRPSTSGGGSTGVSVSLNPDSTSAWSIRTIGGRDYRVNELTGDVIPLDVPGGQSSGRDPSGYDPSTGLPYGVTRVSTTVSPTGLVYQGVPVNPDGSPYAGSTSQVANYTGIKEGPGGLWGLNTNTGTYEKIPGSETLGKAASSGPATYSGGGGGSSSFGGGYDFGKELQGITKLEQEAVGYQQKLDYQRQLLELQQQYKTNEVSAEGEANRAFQAMLAAQNLGVQSRQLEMQDEAQKRQAANDFRSAVSDTDPIAFAALMKGWGNLENALRGGDTAVTDRALGGAAGLLDLIRRPFQPIGGLSYGGGGAPAGGATVPGLTTPPVAADGGVVGEAVPAPFTPSPNLSAKGNEYLATIQQQFPTMSPQTQEQMARLKEDKFYSLLTAQTFAGTPPPSSPLVTGNYSGVWQSVDPSQPNWRPPYEGYNLPGQTFNWETNQNEPTVPPATTPYTPVNTPLTVPGLARGGMARGVFIVGDSPSGKPTGHEEMVIAPQGAHVIPLNKRGAGQMMRGGLARYAGGTDDLWGLLGNLESAGLTGGTFYQPPPQPTYTAPQPTTTTGGSGTTTAAVPSSQGSPVPSVSPPNVQTAPPVATTNPIADIRTDTQQSGVTPSTVQPGTQPAAPATSVSGLVDYGGQQITPDYQALLDEIRNFRTDPTQNVYDRTLNPYDVSFNNLDPISQEVFYRGRQAEFGVPVLAQQWEQQRFRLPGLSRGQVSIGY